MKGITDFLFSRKCKLIVVACNSATTVIHHTADLRYNKKHIVEVISPIVDLISTQTKYTNIGIIGTRKTIGSGMFNNALAAKNANLVLKVKATPTLVPLIEDGLVDEEILFPIFRKYFKDFDDCKLLIPACTHYPILYKQIESFFQNSLKVLHTPKIIAETTEQRLVELQLRHKGNKIAEDEYHLSDITPEFLASSELFLERKVTFHRTLIPSIH